MKVGMVEDSLAEIAYQPVLDPMRLRMLPALSMTFRKSREIPCEEVLP
jgi:hypothetical protein